VKPVPGKPVVRNTKWTQMVVRRPPWSGSSRSGSSTRALLGAALLVAAVVGLTPAAGRAQSEFYQGEVAPPAPASDSQPESLRDVGFDQRIGESVPLDLAFRDADGRPVRLGDFFGERPVVLSLVYFDCPMLCPMTLDGLAASLKAVPFDLGAGYETVVVSFNPEEGPELATEARRRAIHRYGRAGTENGWHFLTGEAEAISAVTEAVGFRYTYDEERGQYAHGPGVLVLTPDGTIARYFFGVEYPPKDLKLGLVEAGQGRLGSVVDQIVLYCFQYDPATGQYAWSGWVFLALRLAALVTLLTLIGFIVVMVRRERKQTHGAGHEAGHEARTASHA